MIPATYNSFRDGMKQEVLPFMPDRPEEYRLSGQKKESQKNSGKKPPKVFMCFKDADGEVFKLNDDSLYAPLLLAYNSCINGDYPFVKRFTKKRTSTLELRNDLQQLRSTNRKDFYAYSL